MKSLLLGVLILMFQVIAFAATSFEVIGPCSEEPILSTSVTKTKAINIGALTIDQLDKNNFEYIGTENKIDSIDGTPVGQAALEIISRSEMRAYGWCFYVNGQEPEVYPNEVKMSKSVKSVQWIFGYAHYVAGEWVSMCEPSWKVKPKFLCDN